MNKYLIVIILNIIANCLFASSNEAELKFLTKRIQNIGNIPKDTVFTKEYKFINNGDSMLNIENIYKSCSCTKVRVTPKEIYPNQEGILLVTVDTTAKIGEQEIIVHLITNTKEKDYIIRIIFFVP